MSWKMVDAENVEKGVKILFHEKTDFGIVLFPNDIKEVDNALSLENSLREMFSRKTRQKFDNILNQDGRSVYDQIKEISFALKTGRKS